MDFLFGLLAGFLGLVPFVHTNLLVAFTENVFSEPLSYAVFVVVLAFSHLLFESVPMVFFGVPGENSGVSVLPAHRLVLEGKAFYALGLVLRSSFYSIVMSVVLSPVVFLLLPPFFSLVRPWSGFVLLGVLLASLFSERNVGVGLLVFLVAGAFGFLVFSLPVVREPLFPLLTGLFGVPTLLLSLGAKSFVARDDCGAPPVQLKLVLAGTVLGAFSGLLPALNPAFLAAFVFLFMESGSAEAFLVVSSSVAASKLFFDFVSLAAIGTARSGAAAAVESALGGPSLSQLGILLSAGVSAFCLSFAVLLLLKHYLVGAVLARLSGFLPAFFAFVVAGVFLLGGVNGLFVLGVSAAIGLLPVLSGVRRSYAAGALIVPAILYSFGLSGAVLF